MAASSSNKEYLKKIDRAISLVKKAELKSVPRTKVQHFLKKKGLNTDEMQVAYEKYFQAENLVELEFISRPLGFSVVHDEQDKNCLVSSMQNIELEQQGLRLHARIIKVNHTYVENKPHDEIIDLILDNGTPITFTFRKRHHPTRGELFKAVEKPTRSLPAEESRNQRESVLAAPPGAGQRGSMIMLPKAGQERASAALLPGTEEDDSSSEEDSEPPEDELILVSNQSNLISRESALTMTDNELDRQRAEMMQEMAKMANNHFKRRNSEVVSEQQLNQDAIMSNFSSRMKNFVVIAAGNDDNEENENNPYNQDMFELWNELEESEEEEVGGGSMDNNNVSFANHVAQRANALRKEAKNEVDETLELEPINVTEDMTMATPRTRQRMNSTPVYSTDALTEMKKGTSLMKYGKRGSPKFRFFQISEDNSKLIWFSNKKNMKDSCINIVDMEEVVENKKHDKKAHEDMVQSSFSIIYQNNKELRLTAKNETESYLWVNGLQFLIEKAKANWPLQSILHINLDKRPGLDLHRRQSLANLLESRTGSSSVTKQKGLQKLEAELAKIRGNHAEVEEILESPKFSDAMSQRIGEQERITQYLNELANRLTGAEGQIELAKESTVLSDLETIKADVWNISVDLVALKCKLKVLIQDDFAL